jgi:hypothetical protein
VEPRRADEVARHGVSRSLFDPSNETDILHLDFRREGKLVSEPCMA